MTWTKVFKGMLIGSSALSVSVSSLAYAQVDADDSEAIIVTGTRITGMKASDSPAPIQLVGADVLQRVGQAEFSEALTQNVPSLTVQRFAQNTASFVTPVRLNGLSPNHALVLVNGKRRHTTSVLSLGGFAFGGAASADLSYIPTASISRVEVLQNGAAAQYGSDAIAGVVNIVQKTADSGGTVSFIGGENFDQGGRTGSASLNVGLAPSENSYFNITAEAKYSGSTVRAAPDARTVQADRANPDAASIIYPILPATGFEDAANNPDWPILNKFPGSPRMRLYVVNYNAGVDLGDGFELYSFGSYGYKSGLANNVYRQKNIVTKPRVGGGTDLFYPLGFTPQSDFTETDFEVAAGIRGDLGGWKWDLASVYGKNYASLRIVNSANVDLYRDTGSTPTEFLAGKFRASQWTNTLDVSRELDIGMAKPATLAFGAEYREDYFAIRAGDPASYYKGGAQAFFGLTPNDAGGHTRNSKSAYVDFAFYPTEDWFVDGAARYEHYSDFGDTSVFKLTSRYDFSPDFAVRGTASTGFRAPTLAEEYYSGVNTTPSVISGQLAPNSPGAALIGIDGLKPEKSTNFSLGFVAHPVAKLSITLDAYQITVRDRILNTGRLLGSAANPTLLVSPSVTAALAANGINVDPSIFLSSSWTIGVNIFANGLDTRTRGVDLVATYPFDLGSAGTLDWTLAANYNKTKVTKLAPLPSGLALGVQLYDESAIAFLTTASPLYKIINTFYWKKDRLSLNLKGTLYGKSSQKTQDTYGVAAFRKTVVGEALIVDAEIAYDLTDHMKVAVGANNLFNKYPEKMNALLRSHWIAQSSSNSAVQYPQSSPYGINGGFYYGRITFNF